MKTKKNTRIFSVLLAICMLVSLLPAGMLSASAVTLDQEYLFMVPGDTVTLSADEDVVWDSTNNEVATVVDGVVEAVAAGTAAITATGAETVATAYVVVDDNPHYYYNLAKGYKGTSSNAVIPFEDMGYAQTTKGSPAEATCNNDRYFESDPWRAGTVYGTMTTLASSSFPVGGAQTTMDLRGYDFKAPAEGDYFSVIVNVPADGTYDVKFNHAQSATTAAPTIFYAAAGLGLENATELGALDSINTALKDNCSTTFEAIELTAGEYEFFFVGPCEVFWCDAIELINTEASYPMFAYPSIEATYGEVITPLHTGTEGYTPVLSTDSDLITINDDGTITCGTESGIATVVLATEEFPQATATMTITVGSSMYFDYMKTHLLVSDEKDEAGKQQEPLLSTLDITCENTKSFTAADIGAGTYVSYGWQVGACSTGVSRDWIWSSSARSMGPYFAGAKDSYATMVIDVPVDGDFAVVSKHSPWTGAKDAAYDMYIAPSEATDPVAAQYKVTAGPISNQASGSNHEYGKEDYAGKVSLTAGKYVVSYKVATQGSGFFIMGLELKNLLDAVDATSLTLPEKVMVSVDGTASVGAVSAPVEALAWVSYESSDEDIATVDENGVITGVVPGTATITATSANGLTATTTVQTVVAYDYLFKACSTDFKTNTAFQSEDYAGSKAVAGCAPFRYVTGDTINASSGDATYGSFFFGANNGTKYVDFEVEIAPGFYSAAALITSYGSSAPANVYLAPVGSTVETEENLILSIPTGGFTSATKVNVEDDKTVMVKGGKYTLRFRQVSGDDAYRYLCMDSFTLRKVSEVKVYDYAFRDLGIAYAAATGAANVTFTAAPFNSLDWVETYGAYSSPWFYKTHNSSAFIYYTGENDKYGAFTLAAGTSNLTIQVELEEGEYLAEVVQFMAVNAQATQGSADVNLYVAPVSASNRMDASYKVLNVPAHDSGVQTDRATETFQAAAGDTYITLENAGRGRYSYLYNIRLYRVGDVEVESFDLTAASDTVKVNASTTVTATNIVPSFKTIEGATWTSSNEDVATVDTNGVVTGVSAGTVTITAEIDGVSASTDITIYNSVLDYEFYEVGKAYNGKGDGTTVFKSEAAFKEGYAASQSAPSAPWMYVSASGLFQSGSAQFGAFMFGSQNGTIDSVVLKIQVDADGAYIPAATRLAYDSGATPATVHIAPVADEANKTADMYYVCTITDEGENNTLAEEIADSSVMLREGEYYLTFQHAAPSTETDRYLYIHDFKLYNVGEYVPVMAESVSVSSNMSAIGIGETATMSSAVLPIGTENKAVTWSSSDDSIATVDASTGVVTGEGNGVVTITGTTTDGTNLSASADIIVGGTYTYDFVKSITGQDDYVVGTTYEVKDSELSVDYQASIAAGSAPWYVDTRNNALISYNSVNAAHGAFFFGTHRASGYLRLKIKVEESGVYTGALRYSDYNSTAPTTIYLAPVENGTENITTTANQIFDIQPSYGVLHQEAAITDDLYLNAGEYYLYFKQNGDPDATLEHRYFTAHYFSLTKTDELRVVSMTDGAQMRTKSPQGLRFIASIDKTHADFANVSEYGIVLLPAASIAEGDELTVGYVNLNNGHAAAAVEAVNLYAETEEKNTFTAVLINIPPASYNRTIAARAYAVVDGEYVYSHITVERSIYEIAQAIIADENASDEDKIAAQAVVDAVNAQ